jgi:Host cell surface-exposed lipoprotein
MNTQEAIAPVKKTSGFRKLVIALLAVAAVVTMANVFSGTDSDSMRETYEEVGAGLNGGTADVPTTDAPSQFSVSEENAIGSAESYLDFSAFSRSGLIDQLEYEGFSTADATTAVDSITVDWNEQAAKSAESYLEFSTFSRSGLIDQLEYEGFTAAQAAYGVSQTGL